MEIEGRRFAITGGAGFVGSSLAAALLARGAARVTVLDNMARGKPSNLPGLSGDERLILIQGDLREPACLEAITREAEGLYHLAAMRIPYCQDHPHDCVEIMVNGSHRLFEAAVHAGVKRLVYASSVAVYGAPAKLPVDENQPLNPTTFYGAAKASAELLLRAIHDRQGLEWTVLRYFQVYGPGMDYTSPHVEVLVRWMSAIARGQQPRVHGDGRTTIDLTHVSDITAANLAALSPAAVCRTYNIATGQEISLDELARTLLETAGSSVEIKYEKQFKPTTPPRMVASIERARRELGYSPKVALGAGVRETWDWYQRASSQTGASTRAPSRWTR